MLEYGNLSTRWKTLRCKLLGTADIDRWRDASNFDDWGNRTRIVAGLLPAEVHIIEFGAGRRLLKGYLAPGSRYVASDIVDRGPGTIVLDLNSRPLPNLQPLGFDVAVLAGVLEYIVDLASFLRWLEVQVPTCVASYNCAASRRRSLGRIRERFRRTGFGWINTFDEDELLTLFQAAGWEANAAVDWHTPDGSERIFRFSRTSLV